MSSVVDIKRTQALLNEYKGNLFEFLVAKSLAQKSQIEAHFIQALRPDMLHMLQLQEQYIRDNFNNLLYDLPQMADQVADKILSTSQNKIEQVTVIGKMAGQSASEADILLLHKNSQTPISLKLSKHNAYVNTKSGGISSFIQQYFAVFNQAKELQNDYNTFLSEQYDLVARELYASVGLEYQQGFSDWVAAGYPQLPGQLPLEQKEILHRFYYVLAKRLHQVLHKLWPEDHKLFNQCLLPLVGLANKDLWQVTCFYKMHDGHYQTSQIDLEKSDPDSLIQADNRLFAHAEGRAYFDVQIGGRILQIRIKPMNKFTTMSYKVNCSCKKVEQSKRSSYLK